MDSIKYKSITPNLLMSIDGKIMLDKQADGRHFIVSFYHEKLSEPRHRLFGNEKDADDFIKYLIGADEL